jgi:hypothetical protein
MYRCSLASQFIFAVYCKKLGLLLYESEYLRITSWY